MKRKKDILDKLIDDEIIEEDKIKVKNKLLVSQVIEGLIALFLLIISLANVKRSILFSYLVFNNTAIIPFFLYISLTLFFCYTLGIIIYYILCKNDINLIKGLAKLYQKLDIARFVDAIIGIGFFIIVFLFTPCNVVGDSMNDTLHNGDRVITTDLFYYEPNVGDIVTFDCSNYVRSNSTLFIKRVIAKDGSKVEYDSEKLTLSIDGEVKVYDIDSFEYTRMYLTANDMYSVFDLTYSLLGDKYKEIEKEFVMPKGKVLVFGDNRANSRDSEEFGAISTKDIFGHVLFRIGKRIETDIIYSTI